MIGFLLSAKVNDSNKGRTRAADRMYRKEKKAKSTAACAFMGPWLGGFSLFRLPGMTSGGALFPRNRVTAVAANRWRKQRMGQIEFPRSRLLREVGPAGSLGGRRRRAPKRCAHFSWFGPYTEDYDRAEYDGREGRRGTWKGVGAGEWQDRGESWWCGRADWPAGLAGCG